jgi:hypothetical protein
MRGGIRIDGRDDTSAVIGEKKKHHPYRRHNFLYWIVLGLNG